MLGWAKAVVHKHKNRARKKKRIRRFFMVFLHKVRELIADYRDGTGAVP